MNSELEKKLWNAGQSKEKYSLEVWHQIIDELLKDFQTFIGESSQRAPEINLDISEPFFGQWIWSEKRQKSIFSTKWAAVIGAGMAGNTDGDDVFSVSLTLFLFDINSKKRLCLNTGESILEFIFEQQLDEYGCWRNLGWFKDANYEWKNVKWEDFAWNE